MKRLKMSAALFLVAALMACILAACKGGGASSDSTTPAANGEIEYKDEIKVAIPVEPPALDPHTTGTTACRDVTRYIYEMLFELDQNYEAKPQLCQSYTVNDDYTDFTFVLRQGVTFHNGKEMKADDVVASLNRWLGYTAYANRVIDSEFYRIDDYQVGIKLSQPCVTLTELLANPAQSAVIMPAEVVEAAGAGNVSEYIGTGSLKYESYTPGESITLTKFEDYQPPVDESGTAYPLDGQWGDRTVYFNTCTFYFVPESSVRLVGVETGEYDMLTNLDYGDIESAKGDAQSYGLQLITDMGCNGGISFNLYSSLFADDTIRAAAYYAVDPELVSSASIFDSEYYYTDACYLAPESKWHTDVADSESGQDQEKATSLLAESSYNGEEIVILNTSAYPELDRASKILQQQLEAVGFNVKLETYDWSGWLNKVLTFEGYDMFVMSYAVMYNPTICSYLYSPLSGATNVDGFSQRFAAYDTATSFDEAYAAWEELQAFCAEKHIIIKYGDYYYCDIASEKVENFNAFMGVVLWGVKVAK